MHSWNRDYSAINSRLIFANYKEIIFTEQLWYHNKKAISVDKPIGGRVVAVVGKEVVVKLPEDVQSDAAVGGGDVVIGLLPEVFEIRQTR